MVTTLIKDEVRALGQLGPRAFDLLMSVFEQELPRFRGLSSLETFEDLALDFFADRGTSFTDMLATSLDDEVAARKTHTWARHWLIDRVRELPYGALRQRIEKRLQRSDLFRPSEAAHHWCLVEGDDVDRNASLDVLYSAAIEIRVDVIVEASGKVVLGRQGQLEEMLRVVLDLGGRLHISDLTYLCAHRFPSTLEVGDWLTSGDTMVDIDEVEPPAERLNDIYVAADQLGDSDLAHRIFDQLSDVERLALRFGSQPAALAEHLGVGRSSAYSRIAQAKAHLLELAGSNGRSKDVLTDVLALALDESPPVPSS